MYGEDGTQRVVYKLKEEHARRDWNKKGRKREQRQKKKEEQKEKENCIDYQRKRSLYQLWAFSIREGESFYCTKVNLVLYTHALQIILFGPMRTQYRFELLQIVSLQL